VLLFCVAADADDEVLRGDGSDVFSEVVGAEGDVDDAAWTRALDDYAGWGLVVELEVALADEDELRMLDDVEGGRGSPDGLHGLMQVDGFAGGQGAVGDGTRFGAGGAGAQRHLVEGKDTRGSKRIAGFRRSRGDWLVLGVQSAGRRRRLRGGRLGGVDLGDCAAGSEEGECGEEGAGGRPEVATGEGAHAGMLAQGGGPLHLLPRASRAVQGRTLYPVVNALS
jgi:hypothetical protein